MIIKGIWQRILYKKLEKRFSKQKVPFYLNKYGGLWIVSTNWGVEIGDLSYIATEFLNSPIKKDHKIEIGLIYHFRNKKIVDHEHCFEAIINDLLDSPDNFSISEFYSEYSNQEIVFLELLKKKLLAVRS